MKILINYADLKFYKSQKRNSRTGIGIGGFDKVISYNKSDIDYEFLSKNSNIFNNLRGAGYQLWKPYIILKTLKECNYGDYIFYCDSGSYFINSIDHLIEELERNKQDIMPFELRHIEKHWSKRDALILMECDEPKYYNTKQRLAGLQLIKNTIKFKIL